MTFDPDTFNYDINELYSADAVTGSAMLKLAKENFITYPEAKRFLAQAALNPHVMPELKDTAGGLFWDINEFYSADAVTGSAMLKLASENFNKNLYAKKFLGKAAAKPHRLPELKDTAAGLFWETQQNFFYSLIKSYPKKDYEDLISAMAIGFLTWLPKYDADNYAPGTFFKTRVLHYAYEEVIKINEIIPEHKVHIKKMLLMQKEALIAEGKAVTIDALSEALPDVPIKDIKDMMPFLSDDGSSMSIDTLGDGGAISERIDHNIKTPEEIVLEKDKQTVFLHALHTVFSTREINTLIIYNDNGQKIADAKQRLINNFGYEDITEDEIRRTWSDAANRLSVYSMMHPEASEYLGRFANLYASKNRNNSVVRTEDEAEKFDQLWSVTVDTICDNVEYSQLTLDDIKSGTDNF